MKFIVDNQLPITLAQHLRKRGFDCQHVLEVGLGDALDSDICRHAELQERIVISKDEDFLYFAKQRDAKIKVIWVRLGNCRTSASLAAFRAVLAKDRILSERRRPHYRNSLVISPNKATLRERKHREETSREAGAARRTTPRVRPVKIEGRRPRQIRRAPSSRNESRAALTRCR